MRKHVAPIHPDASIPDPDRGGFLPAGGRVVSWTPHWAGMLAREEIVVSDAPEEAEPAAEPVKAEPDAPTVEGAAAEPQAQLAAPTDIAQTEPKPDPAPGTVASVPFMITASDRRRLKALGKSDDEIRSMKPEDAQALLADAPAA